MPPSVPEPVRVLSLPSPAATDRLAARLAPAARPGDAVLLEGPLGVGKSAFARAFLRTLTGNPALEVPSPSFTLVQSYELPRAVWVAHHFDLYRLDGPADLAELGWEEAREGIVLVEWPERLGHLRPTDALVLMLAFGAAPGECPEARSARLEGWPDRLGRLLA